MLNREWKSKLSIASMFLAPLFLPHLAQADTSSSESPPRYLPGEKIKSGQLPGGYNETAAYFSRDPWNVILTADYIYWAWQQEMMAVGTLINPVAQGSAAFLNGEAQVVLQTPGYASGFQVGVGCNLRGMDDWNLFAEYTWYHNSDEMHTRPSFPQIFAVSPSVTQHVEGSDPGVLLSRNMYSSTSLHFNNVDLVLQRPFYFGRKLTANFTAGLEALWINEHFTANGNNLLFVSVNDAIFNVVDGSFTSKMQQESWALGPKFGFDSSWLLGYGLKIMGSVSLSALYTSYITLTSSVTGAISDINIANFTLDQTDNYNTVNPVGTAALGLGWGSYLYKDKFHFDLSASYDFQVFWNQNVMGVLLESNGSPGNMSLRGLNVQARFDF
ncbi:MAG: hypothetical protein K2Y01_09840 [Rhabdochlamydiaceae bacterium]|nr:hypothetical protein [Rhabdochlamydiaceae bacterium]